MYTIVAVGEELRGNLMDVELFQWVLLGLLALGIVVLGALLATLGGIKRALEQRSTTPAATAPARESETAGEAGAAADRPAASEDDSDVGAYPPSQTTASDATESGTGTATPAAAAASSGQAGSIRSVLEQHGLSETAAQPAEGHGAAGEPEETGVVDSVFAAHADDPQEEPFQRDGRWWFRRGDELLIYDEASGQWQPAPEGSDDSDGAAAPAATAEPAQAGGTPTDTAVQTTPVSAQPEVADQVATFWKCPTCGAVNGSTAATCRMCFAARP